MRKAMLLPILFLLFTACDDKSPEDITDEVELDVDILSACFSGFDGFEYEQLVIRDAAAYQQLEEETRADIQHVNCDTASLPSIDFSRYTLIGVNTSGGGCGADYQRKVIWDEADERVTYHVSVTYSGPCYMLIGSFNWALIPALPEDFAVRFEVKESYEDLR